MGQQNEKFARMALAWDARYFCDAKIYRVAKCLGDLLISSAAVSSSQPCTIRYVGRSQKLESIIESNERIVGLMQGYATHADILSERVH
jgi:hypothetical protein